MQVVRRCAVTIVGAVILVLGLAMMVLPGPGILVIVAGLAVLATEYAWARRLLLRAQREAAKARATAVSSPLRVAGTLLFGVGLLAVGLAMLVFRDLNVPFWGPLTGGVLAITALILLATTYVSLRAARDEDTTHSRRSIATGSVRVTPSR